MKWYLYFSTQYRNHFISLKGLIWNTTGLSVPTTNWNHLMRNMICVIALCVAPIVFAQGNAWEFTKTLEEIDAEIKAAPDDPAPHVLKCKMLFATGKQQESINFANVMLEKFIKANDDLAGIILGAITTDKNKIDLHFNMGEKERAKVKHGVVRPYSFHVWSLHEPAPQIRTLDFEIVYIRGLPMTAAVGEMTHGMHSNFGTVETDSDFATVKAKVLSILGAKEKNEQEK